MQKRVSPQQQASPHDKAASSNPGAQPLSYPSCLPEESHKPRLLFKQLWEADLHVGTGADEEEDHGQEGLEVEQGGHCGALLE